MHISKRIKKFRINQGLTQEEFGQLFGVSKAVVNNWEHMRNYPNKTNLKKIADYMGTTPDDLTLNLLDYEVWLDYGEGQTKKLIGSFRYKGAARLFIEFMKERNALEHVKSVEIKEV